MHVLAYPTTNIFCSQSFPLSKVLRTKFYLRSFHDTNTQCEGKEKFVLLEQRPTHVLVDGVCEVIIQKFNTFIKVRRLFAVGNGLKTICYEQI